MKTRTPTSQEIEEVVSYLPRLYAEGFSPIKRWGGGKNDNEDCYEMPWPEYEEIVEEFFRVITREYWIDFSYPSKKPERMLEDHEFIKTADLEQIKTMLTFCARGEHFCDGGWGFMIEKGHIRRLLERLAELATDVTTHREEEMISRQGDHREEDRTP